MTALWLSADPLGDHPPGGGQPGSSRTDLRLVGADEAADWDWADPEVLAPHRRPVPTVRRTPSVAVRRRRTLLAVAALLVVGLALPLSGTGGRSHATGSAPAGNARSATYTVRAGDTLWSIVEQRFPRVDPRPLVAQLAARIGSDTVVPGEQIVLP